MKYSEPPPITLAEAEAALSSGDSDRICRSLVAFALHHQDWQAAEALCLRALSHEDPDVRSAACTSLGHIARIHRVIHRESVEPLLTGLLSDPSVGGIAADALDDIRTFLNPASGNTH
jgi:HEAT repeat protein